MSVGNRPSEQVDHDIGDAAVAAVLNLRDIFKLIVEHLNQRALVQPSTYRTKAGDDCACFLRIGLIS